MGRHRMPLYNENCIEYMDEEPKDPIILYNYNFSNLFRARRYNVEEMQKCEKAYRLRENARRWYEKDGNRERKSAAYVKKRLQNGEYVRPSTLHKYAAYL